MFTRLRALAVGTAVAGAVAVLPAGAAVAESTSAGIPPVPPVPPISAGQDGTGAQAMPIPGGSLVQGPAGQAFVPDGFVLVPSPDGNSQQIVPE